MKKSKILCIIIAIAALLCGCDIDDVPDDLERQAAVLLSVGAEDIYSCAKVKGKYKKFAKSCFENIDIYGATFALPMNVNDLPHGFTIDESPNAVTLYNGYYITNVFLCFEGVTAASAEIMYPENKTPAEGQIVTLTFSSTLLSPQAPFRMGGEEGFLSMDKAQELLGECGENSYMIYDLGGGRTITFGYMIYDGYLNQNAFNVVISTVGKCIY